MFPGSSRARGEARVIPIGSVGSFALSAEDPDVIYFEASTTAFSGSIVKLPNTARLGKVFKLALITEPLSNPTLTVEYIDIVVPLNRAVGVANTWRLFSGQRPEFIYGTTGWLCGNGSLLSATGTATLGDLAIGGGANGSGSGIAIGPGALGYSSGVGLGGGADGSNSGVAIGKTSIGSSFGVAVGFQANGTNLGSAVGANATAQNNGAAVGWNAKGFTTGAALGRSADGSASGAAVGYGAVGSTNGVAIGYGANGNIWGVALGSNASTNGKGGAVALGGYSVAQRQGELVKSSDISPTTLHSWSMVNWFADTTTATPTEIGLVGSTAAPCFVLANSAFQFQMQIIAGVAAGGATSSWAVSGAIKRGATAATTALVGTPSIAMTGQDSGASGWAVTVSADTATGYLKVVVTGSAATTIRWSATATLSEIRF